MNQLITVTKSDGTKQLFEEEKLVNSLKRVGAKDEIIEAVVDEVEREMKNDVKTEDIYKRAFQLLRKHSRNVASKYSVRRAMMELGPDGFPFEKFVARIFRQWGYETLTDQIVLGTCVDHEIDVIAWNSSTLSMAEVKYHNEFGMKSDLKVALYVKARFDDIAGTKLNYGGAERTLNERWLFTNTKFTEKAIAYGECNKLKLIAWNYPASGNLHEIIERNGLQPITTLTSLTRDQKIELTRNNIVACMDIVGNPNVLDLIAVKGDEKEKILTESQMIIEQVR